LIEGAAGMSQPLRIQDCACGIGTQTIGLAQRGHLLTACDLSPAAIKRARHEASIRGLDAQFMVADMLDLTSVPAGNFDAVVCFDNSLPHLQNEQQLGHALAEISRKLRTGGILAASIRDYDQLILEKPVVQGPSFYIDQGRRRIVHQVWDWHDDSSYTFHLYITCQTSTGWECHHYAANYRALLRSQLTNAVQNAGFIDVQWMLPQETAFYQPILMAKLQKPR
jgi:glycine/sarcosine N-methyltransferase